MGDAVDRSNTTYDEHIGGKHEEGGIVGTDINGLERVVEAKPEINVEPGYTASINTHIANDVTEVGVLVDKENNPTIFYDYHVHPKGETKDVEYSTPLLDKFSSGSNTTIGGTTTTTIKGFTQEPSDPDDFKNVAQRRKDGTHSGKYSYVLGAGNNTVYIYNENGVQATFSLDKFRNIGTQTPPQK